MICIMNQVPVKKITKAFIALIRQPAGTTSLEYAFVAMLISIVIIFAVTNIGQTVKGQFNEVASGFEAGDK